MHLRSYKLSHFMTRYCHKSTHTHAVCLRRESGRILRSESACSIALPQAWQRVAAPRTPSPSAELQAPSGEVSSGPRSQYTNVGVATSLLRINEARNSDFRVNSRVVVWWSCLTSKITSMCAPSALYIIHRRAVLPKGPTQLLWRDPMASKTRFTICGRGNKSQRNKITRKAWQRSAYCSSCFIVGAILAGSEWDKEATCKVSSPP